MNAQSKIYYVVGASGAGKDTILNAYRLLAIKEKEKILVAHRYITRKVTSATKDESFIGLSTEEFTFRDDNHLFALSWEANNCYYGVGIEIETWLKNNISVVVNGSRSYLLEAQKKYPTNLITIMVDVPEEILRIRLINRQRESAEEIEARIDRHRQLNNAYKVDEHIINSTTVVDAVESFNSIIKKYHNKKV
jgi:ribose 1,5-bisphosphokinase